MEKSPWGVMKVITIFVYVPLGQGAPVQCWNMRRVARFGQEKEENPVSITPFKYYKGQTGVGTGILRFA